MKPNLHIDQWGGKVYATTLRELQLKAGGGRIFKIFQDTKSGLTFHSGYGIGKRWFTSYVRHNYETI